MKSQKFRVFMLFNRLFISFIYLVPLFLIISCISIRNNKLRQEFLYKNDTISLIEDPYFQNGIILARQHEPSPGNLYPYGKTNGVPVWKISEWGTKFWFNDSIRKVIDEKIVYRNEGKYLELNKNITFNKVKMGLTTSNEYSRSRVFNEFWPHLLLEQSFSTSFYLKDLKSVLVRMNGKLNFDYMKMDASDYNSGLHAAQFQLFLTLQNKNPRSLSYGDYLWFGIPFYDNRYVEIPLYAAEDIAKSDATGKFIYSICSKDVSPKSFHSKERIHVEIDVYPHMIKAIALAKERGYMKETLFEEFQLTGMNIGWEVPGTFDVEFEYDNFDISAVIR